MENITLDNLYSTEYDRDTLDLIGVYCISHIEKPNIFYVGSAAGAGIRKYTRGFYQRWSTHLSDLRNNKHRSKYLQRVVNKYGLAGLRFKILEICTTPHDCVPREQYYLDLMNPRYNTLKFANSSLGFKHSAETILKYKTTRKGVGKGRVKSVEERKRLSEFTKTRDLSYLRTPEIRAKVSLALKGRPFPAYIYEQKKRPVTQFDLNGNLLNKFSSTADAAKFTKVDRASINNCALLKIYSAGGFLWTYGEPPVIKLRKRAIRKYDLNMNFLKEYNTLAEIQAEYNLISSNAIRNCFKGIQKQAYGFIWKEILNPDQLPELSKSA